MIRTSEEAELQKRLIHRTRLRDRVIGAGAARKKKGGTTRKCGLLLARRIAAMQHCCMSTTIPMTKRGGLTLPPSLRRKMGLDKMRNPMLLVEEREGGLFLQPAVALPVRDIPKKQIEAWIARDELEMAAFRGSAPKAKKK